MVHAHPHAAPPPVPEGDLGRSGYRRGHPAPARTLLDIFRHTVRTHPDSAAVEDGQRVLTYRACWDEVAARRDELSRLGVGAGDRVGIRMPSGRADLYIAVLAVLATGAAYVPVDHDDPAERAETVWREAAVCGVLGTGFTFTPRATGKPRGAGPDHQRGPSPDDDAWIIFTSGSTGRPKGVAITHRSAAAFVDAEASLFLRGRPLGPGDRVLAGLSVAFDASCEEMWLAWRHGGCLVPAPRTLVRAGVELGPWLADRGVTVVSTVPTLAALWPTDSLHRVRLFILGGEACPEELAHRLTRPGREVWNTYGPTETTVVACAARLDQGGPVRIGLPLPGWELAVLDPRGLPVPPGEPGELVIAGVGTGRYLDPAKDRDRFRPVPALGWRRAYRSGDLVRADPEGLVFLGRADDQVKLGGRRIELGEVDAALSALPHVAAAAAAVRTIPAGTEILVGYLVPEARHAAEFDTRAAQAALRTVLPAGLAPRLAVVDALPTRTSGKVDRAALPWPLDRPASSPHAGPVEGTSAWLATIWHELLAAPVDAHSHFFDLGGTSLATARLVARLREEYPEASVSDVYQNPTLTGLATRLDELAGDRPERRPVHRTPRYTGPVQALIVTALFAVRGAQWLLALAALRTVLALGFGVDVAGPALSWPVLLLGWLLLISPPGRLLIVVAGVRALRGTAVRPGCYPRGGGVHLRLWAAERLAATFGMASLAGTPLAGWYARLLGCRVGPDVDLRGDPPVSGLATLGRGCAIESEADLGGWWLEGDKLHIGEIRVGAGARVGARATLMPGAVIGERAEIDAGSCVLGAVPAGETWTGVPAQRTTTAGAGWPLPRPRTRAWNAVYTASAVALSVLPVLATLPAAALYGLEVSRDHELDVTDAFTASPVAALVSVLCYALLVAGLVRGVGRLLRPGVHPTSGRVGWAAWLVERTMAASRSVLFPLYASMATPTWFRMLGAHVGRRAEISTAGGLPGLMRVADEAFLADDTLIAPYELGSGYVRLGVSGVGRRAFAGNSGIVGPGRTIADEALVAVLSSAPERMPERSSWVGRPPFELPRVPDPADPRRTFAPPPRLVLARAAVELLRLLPWALSACLATIVLFGLDRVQLHAGWTAATLAAGPILIAGGCVALAVTTAIKWVLVGTFARGEHPLWSSFVWRNELFDTFYEELAMPWLGGALLGTPMLNAWLRTLGAKIGRGVWCESHWLPETDLVQLADGSTVNRGCVLQTHLFQDRIMRTEQVRLGAGATLGPHSILLPGAEVGSGAVIGGTSLVMRGEQVPSDSSWLGNPIAPWPDDLAYPDRPAGRGRHSAAPVLSPAPGATSRAGVALAAALAVLASGGLAASLQLAYSRPFTTSVASRGPSSALTPPAPTVGPSRPVKHGSPGTGPSRRHPRPPAQARIPTRESQAAGAPSSARQHSASRTHRTHS
ncbi:MAG TPA: Pls/PosA family non-ribosomal peptide synthetase [Pseudonocardia sp.]|jgi:non-ribosomal peptide synthetase-like protein|nr:Pls/PosA family non-ribosomal peptide synthetase [Pseudonocardia sp.]